MKEFVWVQNLLIKQEEVGQTHTFSLMHRFVGAFWRPQTQGIRLFSSLDRSVHKHQICEL